jgi:hypothetical protein
MAPSGLRTGLCEPWKDTSQCASPEGAAKKMRPDLIKPKNVSVDRTDDYKLRQKKL